MQARALLFSVLLPFTVIAGCDAEDAELQTEAEVEARRGKADTVGASCFDNADCALGEYCAYPYFVGHTNTCGDDDSAGTCELVPSSCPAAEFPFVGGVCGCDGNAYANPVCAAVAGANVLHDGPCQS